MGNDVGCRGGAIVFDVFHRAGQRRGPAGQQQDDPVLGPIESRGQLSAVLHADPAGRAGARVNQAAVAEQPGQRPLDGGGDRRQARPDRRHGGQLAFPQREQDFAGRPTIEVAKARADVLGCRLGGLRLVESLHRSP